MIQDLVKESHFVEAKLRSLGLADVAQESSQLIESLVLLDLLRNLGLEPGGDLYLDLFIVQVFNVSLNELKGIGHLRGLSNLSIGGVLVAIEYVLLDGSVEEKRLLHDNTDLSAECFHVVVLDVDAVDLQSASREVVEAKQ